MLIQGFNTFLPAGYRIECSTDAQDNLITVTTPTGTMMQTTNNGKGIQWSTTSNVLEWSKSPGGVSTAPAAGDKSGSAGNTQLLSQTLTSRDPTPDLEMRDALPIGPAIEYVARIKERVDAETYKGFLAILAKYNHSLGIKDQVRA
jgi:paired amphipathic helix protein Sin3a